MKSTLLKEIWQLWESMAECGELSIGPQFSAQYKRLKIEVETELIKQEEIIVRRKAYHKKWRDKPKNKAKITAYNVNYRKENKDRIKVNALMKSRCAV